MPRLARYSFKSLLNPRTLRSRLVTGSVVLCVGALLIAFAGQALVMTKNLRRMDDIRARHVLTMFEGFLLTEINEVESDLSSFRRWDELHDRLTTDQDPQAEGVELRKWLRAEEDTGSIVWTNRDGAVAYASGDLRDIETLAAIAERRVSDSGLLMLPSGRAAVVVVRPDARVAPPGIGGFIVAARPISAGSLSTFGEHAGVGAMHFEKRILAHEHSRALPGGTFLRHVGYSEIAQGLLVEAEVVGMLGRPIASLSFSHSDSAYLETRRRMSDGALLAILLAAAVSSLAAIVMAEAIRRPVDELSFEVDRVGHMVADGEEVEPFTIDRALPLELQRIRGTFARVIERLASRQAELHAETRRATDAERLLRIALDSSPEGKLLIRDGEIVFANPAAAEHLGTTVERLLNHDITISIGIAAYLGDTQIPCLKALLPMLDRPATLRFTRRDNVERYLTFSASSPDHADYDALVTTRDVTEEHRLETLRGEVLSLVSHDLRSPLSAINGYLDLLDRGLSPENATRAVDGARLSVGRMNALIEDIAGAMHADEVFAPRTMEPVAVAKVVRNAANAAEVSGTHRVEVDIACEAHVLGEEARLLQSMTNLVDNARKYSPAASRIIIGCRCVGGTVELYVEDEGPGIAEEAREAVFERFTRLGKADARPQGLGLGLYIVSLIAANHGGSARVEEAACGGARFVLSLPEATAVALDDRNDDEAA